MTVPTALPPPMRNNSVERQDPVCLSPTPQYPPSTSESQNEGSIARETAKFEYLVSELGSVKTMAANGQYAPGPYELQHRPWVYHEGLFYPMHIGDVIEDRYLVLQKLGYGVFATVWLVRDVYKHRYFALKVLSSECYGAGIDIIELEVLERFKADNSKHPGQEFVSQLVDHFSIASPGGHGSHICLVFDLMAETMQTFAVKYGGAIPPWLMKRFTKQMLLALDFAHKAGVIHTDIKADNIMIQLPNESVVDERYMDNDEPIMESSPMATSELRFLSWPNSNHDLIRSQYEIDYKTMLGMETGTIKPHPMKDVYLGTRPSLQQILELNIAVCDWGHSSWHNKHTSEDITPDLIRSPECLIQAPWDCKTDIWTLGALLIDLLTGHSAFAARNGQGRYDKIQHLYEVTSNFGPFPVSLLRLGDRSITIPNFDFEGEVPYPPTPCCLPPLIQSFEDLDFYDEQDKENCLEMLWQMMRVDPKERSSAEELLKEPWLKIDENHDLVNTLPSDEEIVKQSAHVSASSGSTSTPFQSTISTPPFSPPQSFLEPDNVIELAVDFQSTPFSSPHNIARTPQETEEKQDSLWQVHELQKKADQERHEQELPSIIKQNQKILEELGAEKQRSQDLAVIIAEKDEKIAGLLRRYEGPNRFFEDDMAKKMSELKQDFKQQTQQVQTDQPDQAETQLIKREFEWLRAEESHNSRTQKVKRVEFEFDQVTGKTLMAQASMIVKTEAKPAKLKDALNPDMPKTTNANMMEPAPLLSEVGTDILNANATIDSVEAEFEAGTMELGLISLGTALLVACPKECFLTAAIGAAAYQMFKVVRSI